MIIEAKDRVLNEAYKATTPYMALILAELLETQQLALRNPLLSNDVREQLMCRYNQVLEMSNRYLK
jgi:hypothetical protein